MALAEKLQLLCSTKREIRTAIEEKGQEVGEIPFSAYPEKIQAISGGGGLLAQFIDGSLTSLDVPGKTAAIRGSACYAFAALTSLRLPEGLAAIGSSAFYNCDGLTSVTFPASLETVESSAFGLCSALGSVTFLGTPNTVAENAFSSCTVLTDIYVPWPEGAVEGAPWGAANAQIHYDWK